MSPITKPEAPEGRSTGGAAHPRILRHDRMTQTQLLALDRQKTCVVATFSPLEVHGPHLPFGQDIFEAYSMAETTVTRIAAERDDWTFLFLPPVPVATDCLPQIGSVNFPARMVREVAYRMFVPFARHGFARLAYTSFHGGPRHICALEDAADRLTRRFGVPAVSLFSVILAKMTEGHTIFAGVENTPGRTVTVENLKHDHHAGYLETCFALHLWPELVDEGWTKLPPSVPARTANGDTNDSYLYRGNGDSASAFDRLRQHRATVDAVVRAVRHFKGSGYYGYPALASPEEGHDVFEHLVSITKPAVLEFLEKGREMGDIHSPLWKFRHALLSGAVNTAADRVFKVNVE
ncbi:creatininase family protein [bacterium]|nr:creatininase family protein [bacterium]